jgi:hypothetical protein
VSTAQPFGCCEHKQLAGYSHVSPGCALKGPEPILFLSAAPHSARRGDRRRSRAEIERDKRSEELRAAMDSVSRALQVLLNDNAKALRERRRRL